MTLELLKRPEGLPMPPDGAKSWYWLWRRMRNLQAYVGYEDEGIQWTLFPCSIQGFARRELKWQIEQLKSDLEQAKEPISVSQTPSGPVRNFDYTQITNVIRIKKRISKLEKRLAKCMK